MVFYLFLLFAVMPIIEISVLVQVGTALGTLPTIGLVLLTAALGASLVRSQGLSTLMQVQSKLAQGQVPGTQIVEAMMLAVAGVLLVTPGFVTDLFGLIILTPATRKPIATWLLGKFQIRAMHSQGGFGQFHGEFHSQQNPFEQRSPFENKQDGETLEGEFERKEDIKGNLKDDR